MKEIKFNDRFFDDLERQIEKSKRPVYYSNETTGNFKIDFDDKDKLTSLKGYIKDFVRDEEFLYFVFKDVSVRMHISRSVNWMANVDIFSIASLKWEKGAYISEDKVYVKYWICNINDKNHTKPIFQNKLEGFSVSYLKMIKNNEGDD